MDARPPHEIIDELAAKALPPGLRKFYRPISDRAARMLMTQTPEQRATWLAEHACDAQRVQRAEEKRARKAARR